jgi:hypothetical protein
MSLDLTLRRDEYTPGGVKSTLLDDQGAPLWPTLTHAFGDDNQPKTPPGRYLCVIGDHMLHSGHIRTFEITNVPGHTGILFHPGNSEVDSDGCELVGHERGLEDGEPWLYSSFAAWRDFMARQGEADFYLTVVDSQSVVDGTNA